MESTLFKFVWRFSRRQQLIALAIALATFPLQYLSLEIPKIIINDAIDVSGPGASDLEARTRELLWLCAAFLGVVVAGGLLKMALNLYKGRIGERLMRRMRFTLIDRMLHFPLPEFRRTSQGEVVSMVTAEVEPLGGVMSEAVAQPVFLAGQMLTILAFLFTQSVWLGLASIAFIPLQAYVIPMLQRQLNRLQQERIREVRSLSQELGDTVAAVEDLRANNGVRRREAAFSARLGRIFDVRLRIYRKKYFMKFLNNFINQITPLLYFAIGGWLVINDQLTVGALVAALAAYKDLTNPWKELLAYINQLQDMSVRYVAVVERFSPEGTPAAEESARPSLMRALGDAAAQRAAVVFRRLRALADRALGVVDDVAARAQAAAPHLFTGRFADALHAASTPEPAPAAIGAPIRPCSVEERAAERRAVDLACAGAPVEAHKNDAAEPRLKRREAPRLTGPIRLEHVSIGAPGDAAVLERLDAELPGGGLIAIQGGDAMARTALAQVLARTAQPNAGVVAAGGRDLSEISGGDAATRIGFVAHDPKLFEPTIWDNIRSAFAAEPDCAAQERPRSRAVKESLAAGNSADPLDAPWRNPAVATAQDDAALKQRWLEMVAFFGYEDAIARGGLDMTLDPDNAPAFARALVAIRPRISARLRAEGLSGAIRRFDAKDFNLGLTIAENVVFGVRRDDVADSEQLDRRLLRFAEELGVSEQLQAVAGDFLSVLTRTFRGVAPDHRLFARLGGVSPELLERLAKLDYKLHRCGPTPALSEDDLTLLQELLFRTIAEQLDTALPKQLRNRILVERNAHSAALRLEMRDIFAPIEPDLYIAPLSVLENALYGRMPLRSSIETRRVREIVFESLAEAGLTSGLSALASAAPVGRNGVDLTPRMRERIALARAILKEPDILVFDGALHAHTAQERADTIARARAALPEATIIVLDEEIDARKGYDAVFEIQGDTLVRRAPDGVADAASAEAAFGVAPGATAAADAEETPSGRGARAGMTEKIRLLARTDTLRDLGRSQLRLLAFASEWIETAPGDALFRAGEPSDGVYVLESGTAEIRWPAADDAAPEAIAEISPGRIIGDLSVIRGEERLLDLVATTPVRGLKIGADELLDVVQSDNEVAMRLLLAVSGNLTEAAFRLRALRRENAQLRAEMEAREMNEDAQEDAHTGADADADADAKDGVATALLAIDGPVAERGGGGAAGRPTALSRKAS